jgi:N-acetylmuramoyl-L-alanine amidase
MDTENYNSEIGKHEAEKDTKGFFYQIKIIFGVAFVLATLYSIWTPGVSIPSSTWEEFNIAPVPIDDKEVNPTKSTKQKPLIGIVAGHWGSDSGAVCSDGLTEKEVNLNIASFVQKYLAEDGYEVNLLKEFDSKLTGYEASVLISIHADSCDYINDLATGFKVAQAMASKRPERTARLTACLRNRYSEATGLELHSTSVTEDMTSYHAFGEIDENTPAVIIETGFLNLDRQLLTQNPELAAQGIASGIRCFINNESISTTP